jgi:4-hydroxy-tetrahydrodipicolinate synthase
MSDASNKLTGVLSVFQTPFNEDESIDYGTLQKEINWIFEQGADGIVMAMVSEVLRLSSNEREDLAAAACRFGRDLGTVVISVGAESSHTAERYAKQAQDAGAHAVMAIPPVSIGIGPDQLRAYYERILKAINLPVIVQDASGYVGKPMPIDLQAALLKEFGPERIQYKPEASPIGPKLSELRDATGGKARIFEGTGGISLVDTYKRGVVGTMPGAEIVWALVALWKALKAGDQKRIDAINGALCPIIALQTSLDGFLAVEKHLLVKQGVFRNEIIRGPVGFKLDRETRAEVDRLFDLLKLACA